MLSVSKLHDIEIATEIRFEDHILEIRYRLGALSVENEVKRIQQANRAGSLYDQVADVCTYIGLGIPDGNDGERPIVCTPEGLKDAVANHGVPPALLRAILQRIDQDSRVGKLNGSP